MLVGSDLQSLTLTHMPGPELEFGHKCTLYKCTYVLCHIDSSDNNMFSSEAHSAQALNIFQRILLQYKSWLKILCFQVLVQENLLCLELFIILVHITLNY